MTERSTSSCKVESSDGIIYMAIVQSITRIYAVFVIKNFIILHTGKNN